MTHGAGDLHRDCRLQPRNERLCSSRGCHGDDGTTTNRTAPVAVAGLAGVASVSTNGFHSCAAMVDATLRCWGDGSAGQLGDGTRALRLWPVTVVYSR